MKLLKNEVTFFLNMIHHAKLGKNIVNLLYTAPQCNAPMEARECGSGVWTPSQNSK